MCYKIHVYELVMSLLLVFIKAGFIYTPQDFHDKIVFIDYISYKRIESNKRFIL